MRSKVERFVSYGAMFGIGWNLRDTFEGSALWFVIFTGLWFLAKINYIEALVEKALEDR